MAAGVEELRSEIAESQRIRVDVLKWKLILVAAIGAAGLGLASKDSPREPLLLMLIPFVCLYTDIICYHNDLRIYVIARFLRDCDDAFWRDYETYCRSFREVFSLEAAALFWSTVVLSSLVAMLGVILSIVPGLTSMFGMVLVPLGLFVAGTIGASVTIVLQWRHDLKFGELEGLVMRFAGWKYVILTAVCLLPAVAFLPPAWLAAGLGIAACATPPLPLPAKVSAALPLLLVLARFGARWYPERERIFDGTMPSFKRWRSRAGADCFQLRGAEIVARPAAAPGLLYFAARTFDAFTLTIDLLLPNPKGSDAKGSDADDTGILFAVTDPEAYDPCQGTWFEVQIDEVGRAPSGAADPSWQTGAVLTQKGPLPTQQINRKAQIPAHTWISCEVEVDVRCKKDHQREGECVARFKHGDRLLIENTFSLPEGDWGGHIGLQTIRGHVRFRNLAIRVRRPDRRALVYAGGMGRILEWNRRLRHARGG